MTLSLCLSAPGTCQCGSWLGRGPAPDNEAPAGKPPLSLGHSAPWHVHRVGAGPATNSHILSCGQFRWPRYPTWLSPPGNAPPQVLPAARMGECGGGADPQVRHGAPNARWEKGCGAHAVNTQQGSRRVLAPTPALGPQTLHLPAARGAQTHQRLGVVPPARVQLEHLKTQA